MSTYTFRQTQHHKVARIYEYSFDVTDQRQWESLLKKAQSQGESIDGFPKKAPSDPNVWGALIDVLFIEDLADYEDDFWTLNKGGYEIDTELLDENGEIV